MKPIKYFAVLLGLALVTGVIWKAGFSDNGPSVEAVAPKSMTVSVSENSELEQRLASLEQSNIRMRYEVASMHQQAQAAPSDGNSETGDVKNEIAPEVLTPEEQMEREKDFDNRVLNSMSLAMEEQRVDQGWTEEEYNTIEDSLKEKQLVGTRVNDVRCGESLCQMVFQHNSLEDFETFRAHGLNGEQFSGGLYFSYDVESNTTVVYVAKAGYKLPTPDA
ncbi:MAG: hypothetical protein JXX14_09230 [Deltaproteobacteria bacterium]|nr:hypothetical protein [Deltaproteobacteria bacterium]